MKRRALFSLIVGSLAACLLPLHAQQPEKPVIGFLTTASQTSKGGEQIAAFHRGLRESGYIQNENISIEYRWANNEYSRLAALAEELVRLRVAVIVAAGGHVTAMVAQKATKDIPIVFTTVTDPVKLGLVASLNRPGGNVTGMAGLTSELDAKRLELLHEVKPTATLVGVLVNPNRPGVKSQTIDLQTAANTMKIKLEIRKAATEDDIENAFEAFASKRIDALLVTADPFFNNRRAQVVALAAEYKIPAIYQWREFVLAGGLMSYGPSITEAYQLAGFNAGRVLKGAKPADIPVVQPTRFQLVINGWAARRLGLTFSPTFLSRADEVIE